MTVEVYVDEETYRGESGLILPLQDGRISLQVTPASWDIDENEIVNFRCVATVRDGHDILIDDAAVLFSASRGIFHWYDHVRADYIRYRIDEDPPEAPIKYTGWHINRGNQYGRHREQPGEATVFLRGEDNVFFMDPVSAEVNVTIEAEIVGHDDVEPESEVVRVVRTP